MLIQPIDVFVYAWLLVAVLSAAYVAWDQFTRNPEPVVMKWGFVLITLYMGPIGPLLYGGQGAHAAKPSSSRSWTAIHPPRRCRFCAPDRELHP